MPRHTYCSSCGLELKQIRLALKNKGMILDCIAPHECIEGHKDNITDASQPTANAVHTVSIDIEKAEMETAGLPPTPDRRGKDHLRKERVTTAPVGVLNTVKSGGGQVD